MARNKVIKRRRKNTIRRNLDAVCVVCGSAYIAHRATSKYCSDACKQFAYEEKKRGRAGEPKKANKSKKKHTAEVVEKKKPTPEQIARVKDATAKLIAMREELKKTPHEAIRTALAKIEGNEVKELPFARMFTKKHWENDWYFCLHHLLKSCKLDHIINSLPKSWDWNKTFVKGGNVYQNDLIKIEVCKDPDKVADFRKFVKKHKRWRSHEDVGDEFYKVSLMGNKDMSIEVDEEQLFSNKNIYAYQLWGEEKGDL